MQVKDAGDNDPWKAFALSGVRRRGFAEKGVARISYVGAVALQLRLEHGALGLQGGCGGLVSDGVGVRQAPVQVGQLLGHLPSLRLLPLQNPCQLERLRTAFFNYLHISYQFLLPM